MTDITKSFRSQLQQDFEITYPEIADVQLSEDGTRKYVFRLKDNQLIESVLIRQPKRYTLCISSQVGCAIGCTFCITGTMGLKRNLSVAEIIGQVLAVQRDIGGEIDFHNIVFMGMGEPLQNVSAVISTLKLLTDDQGLHFTPRRITVSTSGLVPGIKKLSAAGRLANLAISLNATTDELRDEIMPINRRWKIKDLLDAAGEFASASKQAVTVEYVLLAGVNDTPEDLNRLSRLIHGLPCKLNIIPYNANDGLPYRAPARQRVLAWNKELQERGVMSTIRWSKGPDISAACGQLALVNKGSAP